MKNLLLVALMLMLSAECALAKKGNSSKATKAQSAKVESIESTESTANPNAEQGSSLWSVSADEKSGGFLGFEVGVGVAKMKFGNNDGGLNKNLLTIYPQLIFGYQYYFLDVPWAHLGFRLSMNVGYTFGYDYKFVHKTDEALNVEFSAGGIRYGADFGFMWDFVDSAKHTFGIYIAPLGFEGETISGNFTKYSRSQVVDTVLLSDTNGLATNTQIAYKLSAGLQLMYKHHHLIFFTYRYLHQNGKISKGTADIYDKPGVSATMKHSGLFSYAYKF